MNVYDKKQTIHNETGAALVSVLMVFVVFLILGVSLLGTVAGNLQRTSGERSSQATYYIAEAGMNYKLKQLKLNIQDAYEDSTSSPIFFNKVEKILDDKISGELKTFEPSFGEQPVATVKIEDLAREENHSERKYKISSTGTIGNQSRTVATVFTLNWQEKNESTFYIPEEMALFTVEPFTLTGDAFIEGDIGTLATVDIKKESNHKGEVFEDIQLDEDVSLEMPPFPSVQDYKEREFDRNQSELALDQNYSFSKINLKSDLDINTLNSDKQLVVEQLDLNGHDIEISGTGKLDIFITDDLNLVRGRHHGSDRGSINTNGTTESLNIYLKGSDKKITLKGDQVINGSLFAEDADINLEPGARKNNRNGILGHIFSGGDSFNLNGNASTDSKIIYMPNAHFDLRGGGGTEPNIKGSIVAKSIGKSKNKLSGNIHIQYGLDKDVPLPVETGSPNEEPDIKQLFKREPIREVN
ncbi:hypothetical protein GCM10008986_26750 [Salinibacillus aidingensis]|uniref:DUF7305 domain-containing protein n=1 Tax=Salinibacillus aidingensis TaxID=237684 RepID=A0ABP3LD81_9BACI